MSLDANNSAAMHLSRDATRFYCGRESAGRNADAFTTTCAECCTAWEAHMWERVNDASTRGHGADFDSLRDLIAKVRAHWARRIERWL